MDDDVSKLNTSMDIVKTHGDIFPANCTAVLIVMYNTWFFNVDNFSHYRLCLLRGDTSIIAK